MSVCDCSRTTRCKDPDGLVRKDCSVGSRSAGGGCSGMGGAATAGLNSRGEVTTAASLLALSRKMPGNPQAITEISVPIVYLPKRKTLRERRTIADVVYAAMREQRLTVAAKLSEGDTIAMQGEVTMVHDDGSVTVRLRGYDEPITTTGEHLRRAPGSEV